MSSFSPKAPKIWAVLSLGLSQVFIVFGHKVSLLGGLGQGYILGIIAFLILDQHISIPKSISKSKTCKAGLILSLVATAFFARGQDYVLGLLWGMVLFAVLANWQKRLLQIPCKKGA